MLCRLDSIRKGVLFLLFSFCLLFVCQCLFCLFGHAKCIFSARPRSGAVASILRPMGACLVRLCPPSFSLEGGARGDVVRCLRTVVWFIGMAEATRSRSTASRPPSDGGSRTGHRTKTNREPNRGRVATISFRLFCRASFSPSSLVAPLIGTRARRRHGIPLFGLLFPSFLLVQSCAFRGKKRKSLFLQKSGSVCPGCRCRIVACRRARCPYILFDCLSRQTTLRKKGPAQTCTRPMAMGDGRFLEKQRAHAAASVETEKKTEEDGAHLSKP